MWRLRRGDELLGEIVIEDGDYPWLHGRFRALPAFADVRPWFDEELALLDAGDDTGRWSRAYDRITDSLSLVAPAGPVAEFLLHIRGDQARFRWTDEPFDED
jgi:hypothetical protein